MTSNQEVEICSKSCSYLRLSFLWPSEHQKYPNNWFYVRFGLFVIITFITCFVPNSIQFGLLFGRVDTSQDLFVLISCAGFVTIMSIYIKNVKKMSYLIKQLSDLKSFGVPLGFYEWNKKFDIIAVKLYQYVLILSVCMGVAKLLEIPKCNEERGDVRICGTAIPYWLPWKVDSWFIFTLIDIYVLGICVIINSGVFLNILQLVEITVNIKIRIDHLNAMLLKCFDGDDETNKKCLIQCIQYHNYIINCSNLFKECFTHSMFTLIVTMALSCGCLESQISRFDLTALPQIVSWVSLIFTACLVGQIIMDASLSVGEAAYNSNWCNADPRLEKYLILIIMRSQRPLYLSAGPFSILSFELFVAIMKFSYSVFMLLNTV